MAEEFPEHRGGMVGSPKLPIKARGRARRIAGRSKDQYEVLGLCETADTELLPEKEPSALEKIRGITLGDDLEKTLTLVMAEEEESDTSRPIGRRGTLRGGRRYVMQPEMNLKPMLMTTKEGTTGNPVSLMANYFTVVKRPTWALFQYQVDFHPPQDNVRVAKAMVYQQKQALGSYVFDGMALYSQRELCSQDPVLVLVSEMKEGTKVTLKIRLTGKLLPEDSMYYQFFNLVLRKCLYAMDFELMGRNFFDPNAAIKVPNHRLELWPGFETSIRRHEKETMLCAELTHKVLRLDNVLTQINNCKRSSNFKNATEEELLNTIVMTNYNKKTYKIVGIAWDLNPRSTFDYKGTPTTFLAFYETRYSVKIKDMEQPLLLVEAKSKDFHRSALKDKPTVIHLLPETCQMTGLSETMRGNFTLMKDLAEHLHSGPAKRAAALTAFVKRLITHPGNREELDSWELDFDQKLAPCKGRVLPREAIVFAGDRPEMANEKADWTMAFRSKQMLKVVDLERWVIVVPTRDAQNVDNLVQTMTKVAKPLNMNIKPPLEVLKLSDINPNSYLQAVEKFYRQHGAKCQLIFVILPNNKPQLYAMLKRRLSVDYGVLSQCFLSKNVTSKGLMSIATKVVIQINAKLGGEPWTIQLPMKKTMFVGFDIYRGAKGGGGKSVSALVATNTPNFASYFSDVSFHTNQDELTICLNNGITKAILAYEARNQHLPDRVILFRDGVGDGQMVLLNEQEVKPLLTTLESIYKDRSQEPPKLTYLVVTKKINTRLFTTGQRIDNPPPGTVCDNIVTLPERYDFFLIAATARQGTVSPCSYTVLHDTAGLDADKIQRLTYKMCHLYYNWSGTVAVPAPCQYAHKLSNLIGLAIGAVPHLNLAHLLHFL